MRVTFKWPLGSKGLRHVADVCHSPQSGASGEKTICNETVYEVDHAEIDHFTISLNKTGEIFVYVLEEKNFFVESLDFLSVFYEEFCPL